MVKFNYTYDATGTRLVKKVEPTSGTTVTTEYLGGFQYENNDLQFFFQPEGYVKKDENAYLYVFQYKDHLGNVRLSYADCNNDGIIQSSSEILEENNYYPFGLKHQGYNDISNSCKSEQAEKYQYNGKEWDDALGLNIYEMDLRQYDPAIGRWTVQDPVTHHDYSPYSAFDNNPVYWSDPSGADATTYTLNGNLVGASFTEQDAIDAFMQLVNGSANDYFEVAVQNTYELSTLPDDTGGGGGGGNGSFSTGDLFALAAKNGVTSKTEAGLAFEKVVLEYLGLTPNKEKFKSKARMLKTGGKYSSVIPDAVSNINVYSLFGSGYYPNSHFHEVKAVTGWLNLISGSSDYQ